MRVPHFLRANKGVELPHSVIITDTESRQTKLDKTTVKHTLWFGWAAYQRTTPSGEWSAPEWIRFTSAASFWTWVEARARTKTRVFVFAHNWSFDAPVLAAFTELPRRGWILTRAIIEGPPVILSWRKEQATILMLDTLNLWRVSLASLGESVGMGKLSMPRVSASKSKWDTYCRRDVQVLMTALHRWWDFLSSHDLGGFASTLAGQAFRTYRHKYMRSQILIDSDDEALALSRASYYGGRCECFRLGRIKGPIHTLDVTSMYPYVMQEQSYPAVLVSVCSRVSKRELRSLARKHCVVADVELETDVPAYAHKIDGRLCFPVGRIRECLTTPDVVFALEHGHIKRIRQVAVYTREPLFRAFVRDMWTHRLAAIDSGDAVSAYMFKILMNSLYGKFGQKSGKWELHSRTESTEVRVWDEVDADTGRVLSMRQFAGIIQQRYADGESRESHPAIAAHVTAYARRHLWSLMLTAGRENVFYVDTDSLWTNEAGARRLRRHVRDRTLGALKREGSHKWVHLYGAKDYRTPSMSKHKGVRKSAVWLDGATVRQEKWSSLRGLLRSGKLSAPTTSLVVKHLSREYRKGRAMPSGRVLPLSRHEW